MSGPRPIATGLQEGPGAATTHTIQVIKKLESINLV